MTNATFQLNQFSPEVYAFIVDQGIKLFSIQDIENKILYITPALETLLGYAPQELIGHSISDLYSASDSIRVGQKIRSISTDECSEVLFGLQRKDKKSLWTLLRLSKLPTTVANSGASYIAFYENQNHTKQIENILSSLAFDPKIVPDEQFFKLLVSNMAMVLDLEYAFLTVTHLPYKTVRMLAFWKGDHFAETYEYDLDDTPCDRVIRHGETCHISMGVQGVYPKDQDLVGLNAQSYLGVPIYGSDGHIKGHLALLSKQPLKMTDFTRSVTTIFARQIAVILETLV